MSSRGKETIVYGIAVIAVIALAFTLAFCNVKDHEAVIRHAQYVTEVSSDSETGRVSSETKYMVSTDAGETYYILMKGFGARPGLVGQVQPGDTCRFTTRGIRVNFLGVYPWIDRIN